MPTKPMVILLVEDNPHDALLIIKALENQPSYKIRAVEDGDQALDSLQVAAIDPDPPDLILLDLKLPKMSGHELLVEIKSHPNLRHIPVVVFSNSGSGSDVNASYALHANCYVEKPSDPLQFRQVIQQIADFWFNTVLLPE